MGVTVSECYICNKKVKYPTQILHLRKRQIRETSNSHSCEASNCYSNKDAVQIHDDDDEERVYEDDTDLMGYSRMLSTKHVGDCSEKEKRRSGSKYMAKIEY